MGKHRHEAHGGNDFEIKGSLLAYEREVSARKLLEAFWISSRQPAMNNKNECLAIAAEFMPFVPLCEL